MTVQLVGTPRTRTPPATVVPLSHRDRRGARGALVEMSMLLSLLAVYFAGRAVAAGHVSSAVDHAMDVWRWQRAVGLPSELSVQHWLLDRLWLTRAANSYYATVHFPLTAAALLWLYLRRSGTYRWTRNVLVMMTAAAMLLTFAYPLAPPRMLTGLGFTDSATALGQSVYGAPGTGVANQFAAMPSLHVGWALLVTVALITANRTRWRWLWLAHPATTVIVVIGTGNHWWVDGLVAAALLLVALLVQHVLARHLRARRLTRPTPGISGRVEAPPVAARRGGPEPTPAAQPTVFAAGGNSPSGPAPSVPAPRAAPLPPATGEPDRTRVEEAAG